jgi:glycosyltransferase involved in cell wall biosynthesis
MTSGVKTVLNVVFEERLGGPQLRVLRIAQILRTRSLETVVVIPRGDPAFASLLREAGIAFRELDLVRLRHTRNPSVHARFLARFWGNVRALRQLIRERGIDLVHTNGLMHLQAAIAARREKVPLVWHLNDTRSPWLVRRTFTPLVERWADGIAIAAQAVGRYYFPDRCGVDGRLHLLYAPVDTDRFSPALDGSAVRKELGIGETAPLVGVVANLSPGKGIEYLLEAAPIIRGRIPETKFLVVGAPLESRQAYWRELLQRRQELGLIRDVIFTGRRQDMPELMRSLSVAVQTSEAEACPMAVLEASASGLPVVATDVGGTPELVEDGVTGLLVPPKSPVHLAAAIIRLLEAPEAARRMGLAGASLMRQRFSLEACVDAHAGLYNAVLDRAAYTSCHPEPVQAPPQKIQDVYSRN